MPVVTNVIIKNEKHIVHLYDTFIIFLCPIKVTNHFKINVITIKIIIIIMFVKLLQKQAVNK